MSLEPLTATLNGRPEAMLGVAPDGLFRGTAWMLGTDAVYRNPRAVLTLGPILVDWMMRDFREVSNIVWAGNERAIRFLIRMGFDVGGEVQTHSGVSFVPFRLGREVRLRAGLDSGSSGFHGNRRPSSFSGCPPDAGHS